MKHYIITKFKEDCDWKAMVPQIRELFEGLIGIPGIHGVEVKPCCVDRANRYHVMIEIDMEREALEAYDHSSWHQQWKDQYGGLLEKKAIFDHN